jgi:DNA-binding PadR family transcriptional regulator
MASKRPALTPEESIVAALRAAPGSGLSATQLLDATGLWSGALYPALLRLERDGRITSAWVDGVYPRRRLYHLAA